MLDVGPRAAPGGITFVIGMDGGGGDVRTTPPLPGAPPGAAAGRMGTCCWTGAAAEVGALDDLGVALALVFCFLAEELGAALVALVLVLAAGRFLSVLFALAAGVVALFFFATGVALFFFFAAAAVVNFSFLLSAHSLALLSASALLTALLLAAVLPKSVLDGVVVLALGVPRAGDPGVLGEGVVVVVPALGLRAGVLVAVGFLPP
mmetsp:Transcript_21427/g.47853  ORF Transcript_21427/g.47853 Transcript_21427/m.47853 type:complete len:206 (-) Transcript_21427:959-1576(-)